MKLVIKLSDDEAQELMQDIEKLQELLENTEQVLQEVKKMLANQNDPSR
jgi:uncharacterized protein YukE